MVFHKTKSFGLCLWCHMDIGYCRLNLAYCPDCSFCTYFRRPELSTAAKIFWIIVIFAFPLLGSIMYVLIGRRRVEGKRIHHSSFQVWSASSCTAATKRLYGIDGPHSFGEISEMMWV